MASLLKYFNQSARPFHNPKGKQRFHKEEYKATVATSSRIVYVGNLSFVTTDRQVYELFSIVGPVQRVIMGINRRTMKPCGFCFVEFRTRSAVHDCLNYLNGTRLDGRPIKIEVDKGFREGRQYGRGPSGGQVRDDLRQGYDAGRGGYNVAVQEAMEEEAVAQQAGVVGTGFDLKAMAGGLRGWQLGPVGPRRPPSPPPPPRHRRDVPPPRDRRYDRDFDRDRDRDRDFDRPSRFGGGSGGGGGGGGGGGRDGGYRDRDRDRDGGYRGRSPPSRRRSPSPPRRRPQPLGYRGSRRSSSPRPRSGRRSPSRSRSRSGSRERGHFRRWREELSDDDDDDDDDVVDDDDDNDAKAIPVSPAFPATPVITDQ